MLSVHQLEPQEPHSTQDGQDAIHFIPIIAARAPLHKRCNSNNAKIWGPHKLRYQGRKVRVMWLQSIQQRLRLSLSLSVPTASIAAYAPHHAIQALQTSSHRFQSSLWSEQRNFWKEYISVHIMYAMSFTNVLGSLVVVVFLPNLQRCQLDIPLQVKE